MRRLFSKYCFCSILKCTLLIFIPSFIFISYLVDFLRENQFIGNSDLSNEAWISPNSEINKKYIENSYFDSIKHVSVVNSKSIYPNCNNKTKIVIGILSKPSNYLFRQAIRLTWAHNLRNNSFNNKSEHFFIIGIDDAKFIKSIHSESFVYNDIIFIDDHIEIYTNLSYKTIKLLQWFNKYCSHAVGIFKTDDDVYLNVDIFWKILNSYSKLIITEPLIIGKVFQRPLVIRQNSKFSVSRTVYKNDRYPSYTTGGGYFINKLAVNKLINEYLLSNKSLYIWEDVAITGMLASDCKIKLYNSYQIFSKLSDNLCAISVSVITHNMEPWHFINIWKAFQRRKFDFCKNALQKYVYII